MLRSNAGAYLNDAPWAPPLLDGLLAFPTNIRVGQRVMERTNTHANVVHTGMSEIRDRAKTAPAKSRTFQDTGFPVSGEKFLLVPFKPLVSSGQERS